MADAGADARKWTVRTGIGFVVKTIVATSVFGILLDIVTAHVAVEYFTKHHPHVVDSESPVVMAFIWGVGASWWFGLIGGVVLWWFNARQPRPVPPSRMLRWIAVSLASLWCVMMAILGGVYAIAERIPLEQRRPTFEHDRRLMAVALTHYPEYVFGAAIVALMLWKIARSTRSF